MFIFLCPDNSFKRIRIPIPINGIRHVPLSCSDWLLLLDSIFHHFIIFPFSKNKDLAPTGTCYYYTVTVIARPVLALFTIQSQWCYWMQGILLTVSLFFSLSLGLARRRWLMIQDLNQFVGTDPGMRKRTYAASSGNLMSTHVQIEMRPLSPVRQPISDTRMQMAVAETSSTAPTTTTTNRLAELVSFDSSDTWASSNPFPSITDLPAGAGGGGRSCDIHHQEHQNEPEFNPSSCHEGEEREEEEENSTLLYQGNNEFSTTTTTTSTAADKVRVYPMASNIDFSNLKKKVHP